MEQNQFYFKQQSSASANNENKKENNYTSISVPQITVPMGCRFIRSIDEKFSVNAVNATSGFSIGFPFSIFKFQ